MYITKGIYFFAKKHSINIVSMVMLEIIMSLISIAFMTCVGVGISKYFTGEVLTVATFLPVLVCSIMKFIAKKIEYKVVNRNSIEFKKKVRIELINKLFARGPQVYDEERTGQLANMIWMKVDWLEYYFNEYLPKTIALAIINCLVFVMLIPYIGYGSLVFLVLAFVILSVPTLLSDRSLRYGKAEWKADSEYYSDSLDAIMGIAALKSLGYVEKQQEKMRLSAQRLFETTMKNIGFTTTENNIMSLAIQAQRYIVLIFIGVAMQYNKIDAASMIIIFFMIIGVTDNAYKLLGAWIKGGKGISGIDEIMEFLEEDANYKEKSSNNNVENNLKNVSLSNIEFAYDEELVLDGVSVNIEKGKTTAVVGQSGSGKSTLAYLLAGFYEPDKGQILLGYGGRIDEFTNRNQSVAAVWQDSRVFNTTCYENIVMGNKVSSLDDVIKVAKMVGIHDKIMSFELGYNQVIGDGGDTLSGGERQRVIIARAMLKDAPVLILDEATSYLDGQNELQIRNCFTELCKGRAVLTIAHRLNTVKNATRIYMIKKGNIIAAGSHDELARESKEYQRLFGLE